MGELALFQVWPELERRVPRAGLGEWPTPVERLTDALYVKRDDASSVVYGGNKVRTLEVLFGAALARGARRIWSTGAYGSNHALASALHAPRVGLEPAAILFPQPPSETARENLEATLSRRHPLIALPHWSALPLGMAVARDRDRDRAQGVPSAIMVPGGATPEGAMGYVSAALELARQVDRGELPPPEIIVIGVGSTCTTAGLLVGLWHAARLGIGIETPPRVVAVRVTPWPVTAPWRIVRLALQAARHLAKLTGEPCPPASALAAGLRVEGRYLGRGYGHPTAEGQSALRRFADLGGPALDTTYSAKSAAAALALSRRCRPTLYWATKSTAPLPRVQPADLAEAPRRLRRWLSDPRSRSDQSPKATSQSEMWVSH